MRADRHEPLDPAVAAVWSNFPTWPDRAQTFFPTLVGLRLEELRTDYCRLALPYRPELEQPAGVVHGGAIATLIDSVVVPAIGSAYGPDTMFVTITMTINYRGAVRQTDMVAEGWVTRRGRSTVFCQAEVTAGDAVVADASLVYAVRQP